MNIFKMKLRTVGIGVPLRQQSNLQVWCICITRGRNKKVKFGALSFSSM